MEKSFILKFDQTKGDYVIVENKTPERPRQRRGLFDLFNGGLFKRQREENQLKNGLTEFDSKNSENLSNSMQNSSNFAHFSSNSMQKLNNDDQNGFSPIPSNNLTPNNNAAPTPNNNVAPNSDSTQRPIAPPNNNVVPTPSNNVAPTPNNNVAPTPNNNATPTSDNFVPTPQNSLSVADSLPLIASLYAKFRILNMIYQNLVSINGDFAEGFNDFININTSLQGGLLNIYNSLTRTNRIPQSSERMPSLPAEADGILQILANQIVDMRQINFQLINLFEVEDIDRQLALIDTALSIQFDQVTNFRLDN